MGKDQWPNRSGISPRTATDPVSLSSDDTILATTKSRSKGRLSVPESTSSCEPMKAMPSLFGELPVIGRTGKKASNARSSATKATTSRPSLSDRLTQSLITHGLIRGTTPSLIRRLSGVAIRDFVSLPLGGENAE